MKNLILEACVESLSEAIKAERNGAHRLELCSNLDLDGLTPNKKLVKQVVEKVKLPVKVMIRPRGGDFVYSYAEIEEMKESIRFCKRMKVLGVVFGILDQDNQLNLEQIRILADLSYPLEVTIHKAIDQTPDILLAVAELRKIKNITSILTSGGATSAIEGGEILKKMIRYSGTILQIIPAGKITKSNLFEVYQLIGAKEYHGRKIVVN